MTIEAVLGFLFAVGLPLWLCVEEALHRRSLTRRQATETPRVVRLPVPPERRLRPRGLRPHGSQAR
jgi:hypothetical protein